MFRSLSPHKKSYADDFVYNMWTSTCNTVDGSHCFSNLMLGIRIGTRLVNRALSSARYVALYCSCLSAVTRIFDNHYKTTYSNRFHTKTNKLSDVFFPSRRLVRPLVSENGSVVTYPLLAEKTDREVSKVRIYRKIISEKRPAVV